MKRLGILIAGCTVLLTSGIGVAPAFADNGPHKSTTNVMNEDRCAGCHRAHTATAAYLLKDNEEALCETCHGAFAGGSALDVIDGVGYSSVGTTGQTGLLRTADANSHAVGALRGGGFDFALIGSGVTGPDGVIARRQPNGPMVPALAVGTTGNASTSQHTLGTGTAWGGGGMGTAGTSVALECGSCHDPHGGANGGAATFRVLKANPGAGVMVAQVASATTSGGVVTVTTMSASTLLTGQTVTLVGMAPADYNVSGIITVTDATHFTFTPTTAPAAASATTTGIVTTTAGLIGTVSSATATGSSITYTYTPTMGYSLVVGDVVNITGNSVTGLNQNAQKITALGTGTFTVVNTATAATGTGGYVTMSNTAVKDVSGAVVSGSIAGASGDGTYVTYTTLAANTLASGQVITITGNSPATFDASGVAVWVVDTTHFKVKSTVTDTFATGGTFTSNGTAFTYTTSNYWWQDDANVTRVKATDPNGNYLNGSGNVVAFGSATTVTSLENNISRWCTTCHTRLLAGKDSYKIALASGNGNDGMYTFRHRSDANYKAAGTMGDSPNCLTCHVSHGSNAAMTGASSSQIKYPGNTGVAGSSFLLRVDNRGTCQMCHNK